MAKGFDCSTPLTTQTAAAFVRDGYLFVARYLVPSGYKALTKGEAELISNAGLQIVSVYETTANRALGGRSAGLADGAAAVQVAQQVGQPEGSCIYFAVDFDATSAQMPTVIAYIQAASEATPQYTTGVYGSYAVMEAVKQAGACSRFWQTYAWSGGKKSTFLNLYQYLNDVPVNGIQIDHDESYGSEGWWNTLAAPEPPTYALSAKDANAIIPFLAAGYEATSSAPARAEFHRLANELRKYSGQPEQ
ncbi:glycoside hydrolase domain-containing protein [Paenibacillus sp. GCM10023248]|uniref:glycoside hydrolase domain-containing protein n=1 Tax=Bacillales TaxID=1385 RepID=UPI002379A100|nr:MULTISPECIES: glycoside hydrolase domain-containing protein [Bacillales]MDD9270084.1 DUF1906 domain-containing protein [Paenibacillus sp. MAHUQ-63]MDR6880219.1 hypothetical protein [Bacillus sp. 3255]